MDHNPVVWFEIYVCDMPRARTFYETTLATTPQPMTQTPEGASGIEMLFFAGGPDRSGASGALVRMDGAPVGGGSTIVYFACADCAVETARAAAAGGKIVKPKTSIAPHGFIALVIDTEGNMFGLHSMA